MPEPEPIHAPLCPLCGKGNACAASASGSFSSPCWCESVKFDAGVLARVPEGQRGKACICAACAAKA